MQEAEAKQHGGTGERRSSPSMDAEQRPHWPPPNLSSRLTDPSWRAAGRVPLISRIGVLGRRAQDNVVGDNQLCTRDLLGEQGQVRD